MLVKVRAVASRLLPAAVVGHLNRHDPSRELGADGGHVGRCPVLGRVGCCLVHRQHQPLENLATYAANAKPIRKPLA